MSQKGHINESKKNVPLVVAIIVVILAGFFGAGRFIHVNIKWPKFVDPENMRLRDLDAGGADTVWLQEDGENVPYVVISSNYDGKVLLMRREALPDEIPYRDENAFGSGGGYYPGSDVDEFLNGEFYDRLGQDVRSAIEDCTVVVASADTVSRGDSRRNTEEISRHVFLLSFTELNQFGSSMAAKEGKALKALKIEEYLTYDYEWLRSAYLWDDVHAWAIAADFCGEVAVSEPHRVRPVFAMSRDTAIVADGEHRYILK